MATARDPNDHVWSGSNQFTGAFSFPDDTVTDQKIPDGANIGDEKLLHRVPLKHTQAGAVVAATELLSIAYCSGTVASFKAAIVTPATGADRTVTIDIQKSSGGGAFASILTAPLVLNNAAVALTPVDLSLVASPTILEDDILQLVVTVAGAAGAQAIGLIIWGTEIENGA
jgi:hypothetical protein